jgi:hypothetical protein
MIVEKKLRPEPTMIEIDLTGPQGNAYHLINYAKDYRRLLDGVSFMQVQDEMMAGDYENLLEVFEKYFGNVVTLYR